MVPRVFLFPKIDVKTHYGSILKVRNMMYSSTNTMYSALLSHCFYIMISFLITWASCLAALGSNAVFHSRYYHKYLLRNPPRRLWKGHGESDTTTFSLALSLIDIHKHSLCSISCSQPFFCYEHTPQWLRHIFCTIYSFQ